MWALVFKRQVLFILNPDAHLLRSTVQELVRIAEGNPRVGMVGPRVFDEDGRTVQLSCRSFPTIGSLFFHRFSILNLLFPRIGGATSTSYLTGIYPSLLRWTGYPVVVCSRGEICLRIWADSMSDSLCIVRMLTCVSGQGRQVGQPIMLPVLVSRIVLGGRLTLLNQSLSVIEVCGAITRSIWRKDIIFSIY